MYATERGSTMTATKVLTGIKPSRETEAALARATEEARAPGSELILVG